MQFKKQLGGLGIKNLAAFNRALRLRWAWLKWKAPDKPFAGLPISLNNTEKELFKCCTEIHVGKGSKTKFWTDIWLKGTAPKHMAPSCFKLAFRKNQSVAKALMNRTWMRGLRQMTTDTELRQFVQLCAQLQDVTLTTEEEDCLEVYNIKIIQS